MNDAQKRQLRNMLPLDLLLNAGTSLSVHGSVWSRVARYSPELDFFFYC